MRKDKIRISLNVSKEFMNRIKLATDKLDLTTTSLIKLALEEYLNKLGNKE